MLDTGKLVPQCIPYETSSAAAALQNGFKKRYKRAVKGLAAAAANFGCSGAENSRITICAAKWLQSGFEKTKNVVTGNGLPLVSTKKRNAGSNNTIIMIHGRGVDKALVAE